MDFLPVDQAQRALARLAAEENIRRHVEIIQDVQFLVDERDAVAHGVIDAVDFHRLAVNKDFPGVRLVDAAEDFHQRGFARAVLADQRDDLARINFEVHFAQREHAGEALGYSAQLEQRRRWLVTLRRHIMSRSCRAKY